MRVLAADIGFGTTDILVYDDSLPIENCPKLVIPSRTQQVAAAIRQATSQGLPVVMTGVTMGGGPSGAALRAHLAAGLPFYAGRGAAFTFNDDLDKVRSWGVVIIEDPDAGPAHSIPIFSGDLDMPRLMEALAGLGVDPRFDGACVAVQDHGFSPGASNRKFRFRLWRELLGRDPSLGSLAWTAAEIPAPYTRMQATASLLAGQVPHVVMMDTGPAALWGALLSRPDQRPMLAVNVGNGHTLAALVENGAIQGLVEHHTSLLDREKFEKLIRRFAAAELSDDEVFSEGGHGCIPPSGPVELDGLTPLPVTGPRRESVAGGRLSLEFAAPLGDMMLTGCFGLLEAYRRLIPDHAS